MKQRRAQTVGEKDNNPQSTERGQLQSNPRKRGTALREWDASVFVLQERTYWMLLGSFEQRSTEIEHTIFISARQEATGFYSTFQCCSGFLPAIKLASAAIVRRSSS